MDHSRRNENRASSKFSFVAREGTLVEVISWEESLAEDSTFVLVLVKDPGSLVSSRSTTVRIGTVGMFLGNTAPFDEPEVLIGDSKYIISPRHLKVITREDWNARKGNK